jgi:outer membrane lipoprotein SlyB
MINRFVSVLGALSIAAIVTACADPAGTGVFASQPAPVREEHGYVESIQVYRKSDNQPVNVGTLLGGIAGGVIGHQIGGGHGNTAATIGGALAGAVVGHEVEKNQVEGTRYRITVHLDSGGTLSVGEADGVNLRIGDRVRVENNRVFRE